ncbi:hypothetical protein WMY93_031101 [Mugilogobius chulae]|uniref:Uncharacterized protein n=1 Tax=Mugilogobius chulae TaxID=88201 RepID=A0AAW0MMI7_9GOBI
MAKYYGLQQRGRAKNRERGSDNISLYLQAVNAMGKKNKAIAEIMRVYALQTMDGTSNLVTRITRDSEFTKEYLDALERNITPRGLCCLTNNRTQINTSCIHGSCCPCFAPCQTEEDSDSEWDSENSDLDDDDEVQECRARAIQRCNLTRKAIGCTTDAIIAEKMVKRHGPDPDLLKHRENCSDYMNRVLDKLHRDRNPNARRKVTEKRHFQSIPVV